MFGRFVLVASILLLPVVLVVPGARAQTQGAVSSGDAYVQACWNKAKGSDDANACFTTATKRLREVQEALMKQYLELIHQPKRLSELRAVRDTYENSIASDCNFFTNYAFGNGTGRGTAYASCELAHVADFNALLLTGGFADRARALFDVCKQKEGAASCRAEYTAQAVKGLAGTLAAQRASVEAGRGFGENLSPEERKDFVKDRPALEQHWAAYVQKYCSFVEAVAEQKGYKQTCVAGMANQRRSDGYLTFQ